MVLARPLTDAELEALSASKSEEEWNKICDDVKRARGGGYPPDWYQRVLASGLATKMQIEWASRRN